MAPDWRALGHSTGHAGTWNNLQHAVKFRWWAPGCFPLAKISGPTGWNANGTYGSNGNFPEQTDHLRRYMYSTFPFQPDRKEITVPFAQHFHFYCSRFCSRFTNFLRHHDLPVILQVVRLYGKSLSYQILNFGDIQDGGHIWWRNRPQQGRTP